VLTRPRAGLTPVALALSPSLLNFPVDLALGIVLPIHAHIGMQGVVEDYVPRGTLRAGAKIGVAVLTVTTLLGLMKLNLCGPGLTESVKSLWRDPAAKKSA
jgi:succinate dehydrogenase (ubiquinone) membrane anchor subunit